MTTTKRSNQEQINEFQSRMRRAHDAGFEMANAVSRVGRSIELLASDADHAIDDLTERRARDAGRDLAHAWDRLSNIPGMNEQEKARRLSEAAETATTPENLREHGVIHAAETMTRNLAELATAWNDYIVASILGRSADLVIHIVERDQHVDIWAVEMDQRHRGQYPDDTGAPTTTARHGRVAEALGLPPSSYTIVSLPVDSSDGESGNATAIRLTPEDATDALAFASRTFHRPKAALGANTLVWLRRHSTKSE